MKKRMAIFVLSLVNIALLANILIPHHHHQDSVCFVNMHCESECDSHDHSFAEHNHDSREAEDHTGCLLDLEVIIPPLDDEVNCQKTDAQGILLAFGSYDFLVYHLDTEPKIPPGITMVQNRFCEPVKHLFVNGSPGLRAPPFC